jgi:heme-degrading monooxygenase HmoA
MTSSIPTSAGAEAVVVLYRWRVKPALETQFIAAWSRLTQLLHEFHGSLGARLHRGPDGLWYSYAQWPSAKHRENARKSPLDPAASRMLAEAISEALPEVILEPVAGFLAPLP